MTDDREEIIRLQERVEGLKSGVGRAHERIDKMENMIRDGFTHIDVKLDALAKEMEPLNSWMNKGKGAITAIILVSGAIGGFITYAVKGFVGK
jgi:hypothetical protein